MKFKKYISPLLWIFSVLAVSFLIGYFIRDSINTWYNTLDRSLLTPPNYWFSIVWIILYTIIGISGWIIWHKKKLDQKLLSIKIAYVTQMILNWAWAPLFFFYQLIDLALICLFGLIATVVFLIVKTYKKAKVISFLFLPYLFWLLFAAYLNFYIWKHNC